MVELRAGPVRNTLSFFKMLMSFFPEVQRFQKGEEEEGRGGRLSISPWVASQKAFISILSFPSFLSEKKKKVVWAG